MQPTAGLQGRTPRDLPRLAAILALATVALCVSTVYLARSLHAERARQAASGLMPAEFAAPSATSDPDRPVAAAAAAPVIAPAQDAAPAPAPGPQSTPGAMTSSMPGMNVATEARLRNTIDELSDPTLRAQRLADMRAAMQSTHGVLVDAVGLQPLEAERALDVMAEARIDSQLLGARCQLTPGCDLKAETRKRARLELDEFERSLGRDVMQRILQHDARQRVNAFAENLPQEQALTEDRIELLAEAFTAEFRQWITTDDPTEALDRQLEVQAAAVLTEEQLREFIAAQRRHFNFN